jgi:HKD family nuclease
MEELILIKKLQEAIGDRRITAAVFCTYNFNPRFFENYLLPIFLSKDVPFNDNEIQNAILWKHYQKELPPITVYFDFFAIDRFAPTLEYELRPVVMEKVENRRPAFHPKLSYLKLSDDSLIIITGSSNLSFAAWTSNLEVFTISNFINDKYFPKRIKDQYKNFLKWINNNYGKELTKAEKIVLKFFDKVLYKDIPNTHIDNFYSPHQNIEHKLIEYQQYYNGNELFESCEIISPYFSSNTVLIDKLKTYISGDIKISVPYKATSTVSIDKELFDEFSSKGVIWSDIDQLRNEKEFRFNHSKVFRFYGNENIITIIGSANFSNPALLKKSEDNPIRNVEFSSIYCEPKTSVGPKLLTPRTNFEDLIFDEENTDFQIDERVDPPILSFELDWELKTLKVENPVKVSAKVILSSDIDFDLRKRESLVTQLENYPGSIQALAEYSGIKVKYNGHDFTFFPKQLNILRRPLSQKIKINDIELLNLWRLLDSEKEVDKSKIANFIERLVFNKYDEFGNEKLVSEKSESTLNFMAMHISALIRLENTIFKECPFYTKKDKKCFYDNQMHLVEYYLLTDNIDTLIGYRQLLGKMYKKGNEDENRRAINPGFYWLLLKIVLKKFYINQKLTDYSDMKTFNVAIENERKSLKLELKKVQKQLNLKDSKLLVWVDKNL